MAISINTLDSQRVQVAAPGTSIAANPQPYENTHTIVVFNRGARVITVGIGTAGGAIAVGGGTEVPVDEHHRLHAMRNRPHTARADH